MTIELFNPAGKEESLYVQKKLSTANAVQAKPTDTEQ